MVNPTQNSKNTHSVLYVLYKSIYHRSKGNQYQTSFQGICPTQHRGQATPRGFGFFSLQVSQGLLLLHVDFIMNENIIAVEELFPNIPGKYKLQSRSSQTDLLLFLSAGVLSLIWCRPLSTLIWTNWVKII